MRMADFIEDRMEHLKIRFDHWIMAGHLEDREVIQKFVDWVVEEDKKALHEPRNPDGKSFFERRKEKKEKS